VSYEIDADRRRFLQTAAMTIASAHVTTSGGAAEKEPREFKAFGQATAWLNSARPAASDLLGKVVLVDFCTYTCINWLRTLPYIRAWAKKYAPQLVLIGVHTPEFPFEHDLENVRRAVRQLGIDYPIAVDNDYAIWRAFDNRYWPALYFLDTRGRVRHQHFGEGEYEPSERMIQRLLADAGTGTANRSLVQVNPSGVEMPAAWEDLKSPENYVGYQRTERFASPGGMKRDAPHRYAAPSRLTLNQWALTGDWTVSRQAVASSAPGARIVNRFHARDLHLVMGPSRPGSRVRFRVTVDGRPPGPASGGDLDASGNGTIVEQRLYQLIRQPAPITERQFEIEFLDDGAEAFAFTFG